MRAEDNVINVEMLPPFQIEDKRNGRKTHIRASILPFLDHRRNTDGDPNPPEEDRSQRGSTQTTRCFSIPH